MALVDLWSSADAALPAVAGADGAWLSYGTLAGRVGRIAGTLGAAGIRAADRVAIVMPNGVDMALALLGVMSNCAAAPINPALSEGEIGTLFDDLQPRALIAHPDCGTALAVARRRGIPVLDLDGPAMPVRTRTSDAADGTVALLLYTSGTTARPKLVPLTQANLTASARNIARTLALTPADRCFNVMPLFHVHGLVGALLGSLAAGGSCYCGARFEPFRFLRQLAGSGANWYSAVPTIHQAVLASDAPAPPLRFLRSCSSHLAVPLWERLEERFAAPVVNCYGMSEAAHQITSGQQRGAVGTAGDTAVTILDVVDGRGEVAIRGEAVMAGYAANPEANATAFTDGWLRTGDVGSMDHARHLTLHGRLKEIINRGGEKISPFEIDEVFLGHPAVSQAIAFPLPHPTLGEEVGLAVVLHTGHSAEKRELLRFGGERLARFKLPREIWVLDEIPKGPTGKPQRNTLAAKLAR